LAEQKRLPDQVVVINDGGESVAKVVAEFRSLDITLIENKRSVGRALAGNQGVTASEADFIGFLDDDDRYLSDHLLRLEKCLLHFDARVAYSGCQLVQRDALGETDKDGVLQAKVTGEFNDAFDPDRLRYENYIPLINLLISRELWERCGGFDAEFDIFEDWDMLLRLSQLTRFYHLSRLTTEYAIWGRQQITQNTDKAKWQQAYRRFLQKHIAPLNADKQLDLLTDYWTVSQERRGNVTSTQRELQNLQVDLIRQQERVQRAEQAAEQAKAEQQQVRDQLKHEQKQFQNQYDNWQAEIRNWQQELKTSRQQTQKMQTQYEHLNSQLHVERTQHAQQLQAEAKKRDKAQQEHQADVKRLHTALQRLEQQYQELNQRYHQEYQRSSNLYASLHEISQQAAVGVSRAALERLSTKAESAYALATQTGSIIDDYQRLLSWVRDRAERCVTQTVDLQHHLTAARDHVQTDFHIIYEQLQHLLNLLSASRWKQVRRYVPLTQHIQTLTQQLGERLEQHLNSSQTLDPSTLFPVGLLSHEAAELPAPRPLSTLYPTFASVAGDNDEPRFMEVVQNLGSVPFLLDAGECLSFSSYCPFDDFFRLDLLMATRVRVNPCQVRVIIRELGQADVLRVCYLDAMTMFDNRFYAVQFEPIADSANKAYQIEIDSPDACAEAGVAVWCQEHKPTVAAKPLLDSADVSAMPYWVQQGVLDEPLCANLLAENARHVFLIQDISWNTSVLATQLYLRRLGLALQQADSTAQVVLLGDFSHELRQYCLEHGIRMQAAQSLPDLLAATTQNSDAEWLWCASIHALPSNTELVKHAESMMQDDTGLLVPLEQHGNGQIRAGYATVLREGGIQHTPCGQHSDHPYHRYLRNVYASGTSLIIVRRDCLAAVDMVALRRYHTSLYQLAELIWQLRSQAWYSRYQARLSYHNDQPAINLDDGEYQRDCRQFYQRWQTSLLQHMPAFPEHVTSLLNPELRPSVLVIDATLPMFDEDSGSLRIFTLLRIWTELGYHITFLPDNLDTNPKYREALEAIGVEVFCGTYGLTDALAHRRFDFAFICRVAEGHRYIPFIRLSSPDTKIFYDTVDIHYVRERRQAEIENDPELAIRAERTRGKELSNCLLSDCVITVTDDDGVHLQQELPNLPYAVIPNIHEQQPAPQNGFAQREGLVFIGNYNHQPNEDAMLAFMAEVMPLIQKQLAGVKLYLIGSHMKPRLQALAGDLVEIIGWVDEVPPEFELRRVFVSYLRYGAGMKGKLGQALSLGLPVVTTSIGAEGMGLQHEQTALIADNAEDFAAEVCRLYQDAELWQQLSDQGREYIEQTYGATAVRNRLLSLMQPYAPRHAPQPVALPPCSLDEQWQPALHLIGSDGKTLTPTQPQGDQSVALTQGVRLRCWVTPTGDQITGIRLRIGNYQRINHCHVTVCLGDSEQRFNAADWTEDNAWVDLALAEPVQCEPEQALPVVIYSDDAQDNACIALWCRAQPPRFVNRLHWHPFYLPEREGAPQVSIVIPVFNKAIYTYNCLLTVQAYDQHIHREVIVIDNASSDETPQLLSQLYGNFRVISNTDNKGFVEACRQGADMARGEYVLFLNNDTQVTPNWLHSLLDSIENDGTVGAVGSKLVYPNGLLQEAGGIIFNDASGWNYGRMQDPTDPRFNRARPVDYCSGASLLIRKSLWQQIGGFDLLYAPAYYEDTDLCFAVRDAGYKVMYCPDSVVIHHEGITAGTDVNSGYKAYQTINKEKFLKKWAAALAQQLLPPPQISPEAAAWRWAALGSFPTPKQKIRATHYFAQGSAIDCWSYYNPQQTEADLARLVEMDFNTVILVIPWVGFQPSVNPIRYHEEYWQSLDQLLAQIQMYGLQVILRLGFAFEHGVKHECDMLMRSVTFLTDEAVQEAWTAFLTRMWETVRGVPHVVGGFITWEDMQLHLQLAGEKQVPDEMRLKYAKHSGYQAFLAEHYSLETVSTAYQQSFKDFSEVPAPAHNTPAQRYFLRFCDELLQQIFQAGRAAFPPLTMEVRMDCEALGEAGQYFCHYPLLDIDGDTHTTMLYYSPSWGALNTGEQVSAKDALDRLQHLIDTVRKHTPNTLFFDQFNFIDNTPGFESNTTLDPEALPDFLHYAAQMLQHHTMGYSLWTVQDKPMNLLRNGLFERQYPCWEFSQGEVRLDEASQRQTAYLPTAAQLSQAVPTSSELVLRDGKPFTLVFQVKNTASASLSIELLREKAETAHWQQTVSCEASADTWQTLRLTDVDFLMGDTLRISNQGTEAVMLTGFYLYQICQENGVLDINGEPKAFYDAFVKFNQAIR